MLTLLIKFAIFVLNNWGTLLDILFFIYNNVILEWMGWSDAALETRHYKLNIKHRGKG